MNSRLKCVSILTILVATIPVAKAGGVEKEVLAVADSVFELISSEDFDALSELMIDEAMKYTVYGKASDYRIRVRNRSENAGSVPRNDLVERGFSPTVLVSGPLATVWYPYDFYVDGEWSHCGVDVMVMGLTENGWRIMSMAWNVLQPPECKPHPDRVPK